MRLPALAVARPQLRRGGRRTSGRHRVLIAFGIVLLVVAGSGIATALAYRSVRGQADQLQAQLTGHLQNAQSELEAARTALATANANHDEALVAKASAHFTNAKVEFAAARRLADNSQLLDRLESLPAVGKLAT